MNDHRHPFFFRPLVCTIGWLIIFCCYLLIKGKSIYPAKLALAEGMFLAGAVILVAVQSMRKKEFDWLDCIIGVPIIGLTIGGGILIGIKGL